MCSLFSGKGQIHQCTCSLKALIHFFFQFLSAQIVPSHGEGQECRHGPGLGELTLARCAEYSGGVLLVAGVGVEVGVETELACHLTSGPAKICSETRSDQVAKAIRLCLLSQKW